MFLLPQFHPHRQKVHFLHPHHHRMAILLPPPRLRGLFTGFFFGFPALLRRILHPSRSGISEQVDTMKTARTPPLTSNSSLSPKGKPQPRPPRRGKELPAGTRRRSGRQRFPNQRGEENLEREAIRRSTPGSKPLYQEPSRTGQSDKAYIAPGWYQSPWQSVRRHCRKAQ